MENEYRVYKGLEQRSNYRGIWDMPIYDCKNKSWSVLPGDFPNGINYRRLEGFAILWGPK